MITSGNKQTLSALIFFAMVAVVGGLLYLRHERQAEDVNVEARVVFPAQDLKRKAEDALKLAQGEEELAKAQKELTAAKKALKAAEDTKAALTPKWWPYACWAAALGLLAAFLAALNLAGEHAKRFLLSAALALGAVGFLYARGITRGIDLKGGAEMRYRMDTASIDAKIRDLEELRAEMTTNPQAAKDKIQKKIDALKQQFDAENVSEASKNVLKQAIDEQSRLLTDEGIKKEIDSWTIDRKKNMAAAVDTIRRRVDAAGIREVSVQATADGGMILQVPIKDVPAPPGASAEQIRDLRLQQLDADVRQLKSLIEKPGHLTFNDVDACNSYTVFRKRWDDALAGKPPPGYEIKKLKSTRESADENEEERTTVETLLLVSAPITEGKTISRAVVFGSDTGGGYGYKIEVYLDTEGGQAISEFTAPGTGIKFAERRMAIVLDGDVVSAPTVQSQLGSTFEITGRFTQAEAGNLAQILNAGSLKYKPILDSQTQVGPGLGQDSITAGTRASLVGSGLVVLFMAVYYLAGGVAANVALFLNILLLLGAMAALGGTMTLPGIAGIALTVGMAVDANVLIFERVREEKARGKPLKLALKAGHDRALVTIVDSNITTLIIGFILYLFGTGPVKGFAITLSLGLIINLFTALYVSRAVTDYFLAKGWLTEFKMLKVIGVPKIPFMRLTPAAAFISALLVAGSIFLFSSTRDKYGLDFTGGLEVQVALAEPAATGAVRAAVDKGVKEAMNQAFAAAGHAEMKAKEFSVQAYSPDAAGRSKSFRVTCQLSDAELQVLEGGEAPKAGGSSGALPGAESPAPVAAGTAPKEPSAASTAAAPKREITRFFRSAFESEGKLKLAAEAFPLVSKTGMRVAGELQGKAIMAFIFSLGAIFIYIVLRFDFMVGFGLGAVITLFHDSAMAVGAMMVANRLGMPGAQIDLVVLAAILTIIGFSINDTIVIFDRIRENRAAMRSMSFGDIVDLAINQTLSRTILTNGTVLVAALSLMLLGGPMLRPFALVFLVGVFTGTYSSVLAAWIGVRWETWRERRREALKLRLRSASAQTS